MGTRADFYVGRGAKAEWLGSIAWDGYEDGLDAQLLGAQKEKKFRKQVALLAKRDDWTSPEQGWPWPWTDSCTTDYAYAFDGERVWVSCFGGQWYDPVEKSQKLAKFDKRIAKAKTDEERDAAELEREEYTEGLYGTDDDKVEFPDMTERQNVTLGSRSGVLVFGGG
jgi:hypothetical protein